VEFSLNIISMRKVATNVVHRRLCGHVGGRFSHSFLASDCNAILGARKESIGLQDGIGEARKRKLIPEAALVGVAVSLSV
jgi:hypothetical protein